MAIRAAQAHRAGRVHGRLVGPVWQEMHPALLRSASACVCVIRLGCIAWVAGGRRFLCYHTRMRYRLALIALLLSVMFIPAVARAEQPATRPYYLHLNGIGGERLIDHTLVGSLRDGGFNAEFELYDWTTGQIGIEALTDVQKHRARPTSSPTSSSRPTRPTRIGPIPAVRAHAGAGIGCWALELLPEDVRVENWFMFAPALSPDYDLSKALKHVHGKAYVFSSTLDAAVLDAGTTLFGTVDGVKGEAAGLADSVSPREPTPSSTGRSCRTPTARNGPVATPTSAATFARCASSWRSMWRWWH